MRKINNDPKMADIKFVNFFSAQLIFKFWNQKIGQNSINSFKHVFFL